MREIDVKQITDVVEKLCIEANEHLPEDVKCAIKNCRACEDGEIAKGVLDNIIENFEIADNECVPICQDTGMACVFLEIGQDVPMVGGDLADAINEAYGDALVTSLILPELFFNGFPFVFEIYYEGARRPAQIRIIPEEEY